MESSMDSRSLILKGEIHTLLSFLRLNTRWASSARFTREIPLQEYNDILELDCLLYLRPFLEVISSQETSGPMTALAISAVNKFVLYGFLGPATPRGQEAVNEIARAATECRFEATGPEDDEATLMKLLELMENTVRCPVGWALEEDVLWEMLQATWKLSRVNTASHLLRVSAENMLKHMILTIFSRLGEMELSEGEEEEEGQGSDSYAAGSSAYRAPKPYTIRTLARVLQWLSSLLDPANCDRSVRASALRLINIILETGGLFLAKHEPIVKVAQAHLCKWLVSNSRGSTTARIPEKKEIAELDVLAAALRVVFNLFVSMKEHLKVQLEVFFTSVHLYLADSPSATGEQRELALESLLEFCREPAMIHDLYINYDCDVACTNLFEILCKSLCKVAVPRESPLNSLNVIALEAVLAVVESIARRCTSTSLPPRARTAGLDLEDAVQGTSTSEDESYSATVAASRARTEDVLRRRKVLKKKFQLVSTRFNKDQKNWIPYAEELGLLNHPATPTEIARFLRECPGLDKEIVGDYISQPDIPKYALNTKIRKAYVSTFDFRDVRIDEALRRFLAAFRLPGEAQKIERLMESFADQYYKQGCGGFEFASADTVFILAFSTIMLQTDRHNHQVQRKMTLEQFIKNNAGIDDGKNLPEELLRDIFNSIAEKPIQITPNVSSLSKAQGAPVEWEGVLQRQQDVTAYTTSSTDIRPAGVHERDMFLLVAEPVLGAINVVLQLTRDEVTVAKALNGFRHLIMIGSYFDMPPFVNQVFVALTKHTEDSIQQSLALPHASLHSVSEINRSRHLKEVEREVQSPPAPGDDAAPPASDSSLPERKINDSSAINDLQREQDRLRFASDASDYNEPVGSDVAALFVMRRGLLTLRTTVQTALQYAPYLREAWRNLVNVIWKLQDIGAFPPDMLSWDDFRWPNGSPIPSTGRPSAKQTEGHVASKSEDKGFFASLTSYFLSDAAEDVETPNPVAVDALKKEISRHDSLKKLFTATASLCEPSLRHLLQALILTSSEQFTSTRSHSEGANSSVVALETITFVSLRNVRRAGATLPMVIQHCKTLMSIGKPSAVYLVERVCVNLYCLALGIASDLERTKRESPGSEVAASQRSALQQITHLLGNAPAAVYSRHAVRISAGLTLLVKTCCTHVLSPAFWSAIGTITQRCLAFNDCYPFLFDAIQFLVYHNVLTPPALPFFLHVLLSFLSSGLEPRRVMALAASIRDVLADTTEGGGGTSDIERSASRGSENLRTVVYGPGSGPGKAQQSLPDGIMALRALLTLLADATAALAANTLFEQVAEEAIASVNDSGLMEWKLSSLPSGASPREEKQEDSSVVSPFEASNSNTNTNSSGGGSGNSDSLLGRGWTPYRVAALVTAMCHPDVCWATFCFIVRDVLVTRQLAGLRGGVILPLLMNFQWSMHPSEALHPLQAGSPIVWMYVKPDGQVDFLSTEAVGPVMEAEDRFNVHVPRTDGVHSQKPRRPLEGLPTWSDAAHQSHGRPPPASFPRGRPAEAAWLKPAVTALQRLLLGAPSSLPRGFVHPSPTTSALDHSTAASLEEAKARIWKLQFDYVMFPLVQFCSDRGLAAASTKQIPPNVSWETYSMEVMSVLSRLFLHNAPHLMALPDFHSLWLRLVGSMCKHLAAYQREGKSSGDSEALFQVLQNLIIVVASEDFLAPKSADPYSEKLQEVWRLTWAVVAAVCPESVSELQAAVQTATTGVVPNASKTGEPAPAAPRPLQEAAVTETEEVEASPSQHSATEGEGEAEQLTDTSGNQEAELKEAQPATVGSEDIPSE